MARQQDLIDELVGEPEQAIDRSLRGQALRRADQAELPRTLTAWEWEAYYLEHGQPEAHASAQEIGTAGWWVRLRSWWRQRQEAG